MKSVIRKLGWIALGATAFVSLAQAQDEKRSRNKCISCDAQGEHKDT